MRPLSSRPPFAIHATLLAILSAITLIGLLYSGALQTTLSANPDEAAHYVTALMIRGYVDEGLNTPPLQFAEKYYVHYPKVAFGVWPPLFHTALAGWMLITVPSPAAALILVAVTLVALAYVMFRSSLAYLGLPLAVTAAVWFVLLPTVQRTAGSLLLDVPCALLMVSAAVAFGRYLDTGHRRDVVLFAILASAALMTKNNGLAVGLVPPIAIAVSRKWSLLRSSSLWLAPLIVAAVCVPWYFLTWDLFKFVAAIGGNDWGAPRGNLFLLAQEPGIVFIPLALLGAWSTVGRGTTNGLWNSMFALTASVWLFHSVVYPISAPRYLLAAYAGIVLFCVAGLRWIANQILIQSRTVAVQAVLGAAVLATFLVTGFRIQQKPHRGFVDAAEVMFSAGLQQNGTALVCSDPIGEGLFIAAVATREKLPKTIVLRASKLLAESSWVGTDYEAKHDDVESMLKAIDQARVEFVAMDDAEENTHHKILVRALSESSDWSMVHEVVPAAPTPERSTVRIYRRTTPLLPGAPEFEIDIRNSVRLTLHE